MSLVTPFSLLFSLRTFATAMLALYLAFELDLSRPLWSFLTVYIIASPFLGAVRSKALYRLCGTIGSSVFCVIMVPALVDTPALMVFVFSLWIGFCLYLSHIDGTPRGYAFMLAGYTTGLVAFPSVDTPNLIFDIALARTEEIALAIACTFLASYLPFHKQASHDMLERIDRWMGDAAAWAKASLSATDATTARNKLLGDLSAINTLRAHANYDMANARQLQDALTWLQRCMHNLFAAQMLLETEMETLRSEHPALAEHIAPLWLTVAEWFATQEEAMPHAVVERLQLCHDDVRLQPAVHALQALTDSWQECLEAKQLNPKTKHDPASFYPIQRYTDHFQAALFGGAVAVATLFLTTLWIVTAWPDGGTAAMLGIVGWCLFGSLDVPANSPRLFLQANLVGCAIAALYNFVIFPRIDGFPLFAFALSISCIPIGILMASRRLTLTALPILVGLGMASFQNHFEADIAFFLNAVIAQSIGFMFAGLGLHFVRAFSMRRAMQRLHRRNAQELALLLQAKEPPSHVVDRMMHRASLLLSREQLENNQYNSMAEPIFRDLQMGQLLAWLAPLLSKETPATQQAWKPIAAQVGYYFNRRDAGAGLPASLANNVQALFPLLNSREAALLGRFHYCLVQEAA